MVSKEYGERIFEGIGGNLKKKKRLQEGNCKREQMPQKTTEAFGIFRKGNE